MQIPSKIVLLIFSVIFTNVHCSNEHDANTHLETPQRSAPEPTVEPTPGQLVSQRQAEVLTKERFVAVLGEDVVTSWGIDWGVFTDSKIEFDAPQKSRTVSAIHNKMTSLLKKRFDEEFMTLYGSVAGIRGQREAVHADRLDMLAIKYFTALYPNATKIEPLDKQGGVQLGERIKVTFPDGSTLLYHVKTHSEGRLFDKSSAPKLVNPQELLAYKILELLGFGCEVHFFAKSAVDVYIATLDANFVTRDKKGAFNVFQIAAGRLNDTGNASLGSRIDEDEDYGQRIWGALYSRRRQIPETAEVGGHVDLTGCSQLRQLPEWLLGIGGVPGHFGLLRIISLAGTGVSPDVLHQLDMLEQHDVHFDIGHDLPSSKAKAIECRYGSEAEHILKVLQDNPHKDMFIKYAGSAGIDQGGLSRQAFYKAYEQLLKKPLFRPTADQSLMFILNADKGQEQAYQDFAMILARISKLNMGVGQDLPHEFFVQLNIGLHEIKNFNKDESLMGQLAALDNKALFKLLDIIAPETLNTQDKKDYFKKLSLTDARQYIYDLSLAPLALAAGFLKAGGKAEAIDRIRERICGPADLKKKAIEALEVHVSRTHIDDYAFAKTLKADMSKLLKQDSDQELKAFCLEVTGAPSLCGKKPRLALYTFDDVQAKDVMTRAHSCSRTMDINLASLALAQKNSYTKALKTALFSGTAMFSDA